MSYQRQFNNKRESQSAEALQNNIELNDYQLGSINGLSRQTLFIGIFLSIFLHIVIFTLLVKADLLFESSRIQDSFSKNLTIDIITTHSDFLDKQQSKKEIEQSYTENSINEKQEIKALQSSDLNLKNKQQAQKIKHEEQTPSLPEMKKSPLENKNQIIVKSTKDENKRQAQPRPIVYEDILDQAVQLDQTVESQNELLREDFTVFSKELRDTLEVVRKEKSDRKEYLKNKQLKEKNKYFEYNNTGGSKRVRINGNCFEVPQDDPFDLVPKTWRLVGNCSKSREIKFKAKTLNKQYQESLKDKRKNNS
ncbi:hypothetical protein [Spartinivicinus poritis]|uniref:Uncharacterized protein n=1 Tax=Spartinivicinus poritis TaxID=2994640 RepID=A0ABT5UCB3_9GAMM|nr:hypothetical protein [Spartinivicinus sp. A2-2]MDE1464018.1 hypothetical protein [Spartinivicinus sp. A2-2]